MANDPLSDLAQQLIVQARDMMDAMETDVDLHHLTDTLLGLEPADRLAVATVLLNSVEGPESEEWTRVWTKEIRERSASAAVRDKRGASWSDLREQLLRELAEK